MSITDRNRNTLVVLLFLLPSLLGFVLFILVPILSSAALSFTDYSGGVSMRFIGLKNYLRALASERFRHAFFITAYFVLVSVSFQLLLGFLFALVLNGPIRGRNFFRGLLFLPTILSAVAISLSFMLILHPEKGPANRLLESIGLQPSAWLASSETALLTILIVFIWQTFGYYMVLFLSGLQGIPPTLYEVADLDGAGPLRKLRSVTIPMLSPVFFFCFIMAVIKAFQVFEQVYVMTGGQDGGGPAGSTSVLVFDIYVNAFSHFQMGYASAEAVILLLIVLTVTVVQYRGQRKWVSYDLA